MSTSLNYLFEKGEKENNNTSKINKSQNEENSNDSKNLNNSKIINQSSISYQYPICLYNEKDPLDEYKLKVIKARNKSSDKLLNYYFKFNFAKSDVNNENNQIINNNNIIKSKCIKENKLENSKNNLFLTDDNKKNKLPKTIKSLNHMNHKDKGIDVSTHKKILPKSKSDIFNPYSNKSISKFKTLQIIEMEKRGNQYNKRRMASLQRIALHNFSSMNANDGHIVSGSIPTGKSDESYILETRKRKKLPGIREYICYRLKSMRKSEINTPEFYLQKFKKYEKKKLPEIIDIKNSGRFQFHVFHDQYGFRKELDKRENRGLKMSNDKIRDLKIMAKINRTNDPYLADIYRRALYFG